jgi:valyl-tRNA synthetase
MTQMIKVTLSTQTIGNLPPSATCVLGNLICAIPLEGVIDPEAECIRIQKTLDKIAKELTSSEKILENPGYLERAPKEVVEAQIAQCKVWKDATIRYQSYLKQLKQL